MSIAALPTPLQHLGGRRFCFYPPIRNLEPNEWLYRRATWSECVVANTRSGEEFCVPRIFLGEVSRVDEPVMVVSLSRELEWRNGAIIPRRRRVIEFPTPPGEPAALVARTGQLAPVVNIRLETTPESRVWKWVGVAAVLGAVALTIAADVARQTESHTRADLFRGYRSYLQLTPDDGFDSVIQKLGHPANVSMHDTGQRVFRSLAYPSRHYSVILMGPRQGEPRYIGTVDMYGRVLDAVRFQDGSSAEPFLNPDGMNPAGANPEAGSGLPALRSLPGAF